MKKLKLRALALGATEVLTRAQLKNVLGGDGSGNGSCVSECRSGETCSNGRKCAMVNCMSQNPTTLIGIC